MWYRDYTLVQQRIQDVQRGAREASVLAALFGRTPRRAARRQSRIRALSAAGTRRVGQAVIGLSDWIDARASDADCYQCGRQAAIH